MNAINVTGEGVSAWTGKSKHGFANDVVELARLSGEARPRAVKQMAEDYQLPFCCAQSIVDGEHRLWASRK